jgi:hypothetical protein
VAISRRTAIIVWTDAGGMCCFPECRAELVRDGALLVGQAAHIIGRRAAGPRGSNELSNLLKDDPKNVLLLCHAHHEEIDRNADKWPSERLRQIKASHEQWVRGRLAVGTPWTSNLNQLEYINLPRLIMLAELNGIATNLKSLASAGSMQNFEPMSRVQVMLLTNAALEAMHVNTVELNKSISFSPDLVGSYVSFNEAFRTKNYAREARDGEASCATIGDPVRGPQIYRRFGAWKIVFPIDPRWITTSTAHSDFCSGNHRFAGLGMIKNVDVRQRSVTATPLVLGVPKTPWDSLFQDK